MAGRSWLLVLPSIRYLLHSSHDRIIHVLLEALDRVDSLLNIFVVDTVHEKNHFYCDQPHVWICVEEAWDHELVEHRLPMPLLTVVPNLDEDLVKDFESTEHNTPRRFVRITQATLSEHQEHVNEDPDVHEGVLEDVD